MQGMSGMLTRISRVTSNCHLFTTNLSFTTNLCWPSLIEIKSDPRLQATDTYIPIWQLTSSALAVSGASPHWKPTCNSEIPRDEDELEIELNTWKFCIIVQTKIKTTRPKILLSQPQHNVNTVAGLDTKMTVHTTPAPPHPPHKLNDYPQESQINIYWPVTTIRA